MGKSCQTLWRKVYPVCYHHSILIVTNLPRYGREKRGRGPKPILPCCGSQQTFMKHDSPKQRKKGFPFNRWVIEVFFLTLFLSAAISAVSDAVISDAELWVALAVLAFLIFLGVIFDMVGVAVTGADSAPFVAMASRKVRGAKQSILILKHAERVASFCNDVIGDICGVVSGAAGATITAILYTYLQGTISLVLLGVLVSACISALTVSLKAWGKTIAMSKSKEVVRVTGVFLSFFMLKTK